MSYCRWSSDDFRCDLYCYEHVYGGWTTHVAGNRIVTPVFPHPSLSWIKPGLRWGWLRMRAYMMCYRLHMLTVRYGIRRDIGLPQDGETYSDPTLEEFLERLLWLRREGYNFPDYVLESVREEIAEQAA